MNWTHYSDNLLAGSSFLEQNGSNRKNNNWKIDIVLILIITFQGQLITWRDSFVATHSCIILMKVWLKFVVNCWDRIIFVNFDFDMHFHGQLARFFLSPVAIPSLWLKFDKHWSKGSRNISKTIERYPYLGLNLCSQGHISHFW